MDADPETSLLIANLILDDISELENRRKGKNRHDTPQTDEELSLSLQERHLRDLLGNIQDFQFAQGLDRALSSDLRLINTLSIAERAAHDDRVAALALSEGRPLPAKTPSQRHVETMTFARPRASQDSSRGAPPTLSSSTSAYGFHPASSSSMATTSPVYGFRPAPAESAVSAGTSRPTSAYRSSVFVTSTTPTVPPARRRECVSCMEGIQRGGITGLCGHDYCSGCIVDLVTSCTKDESLYPLRCCGQNLDERQILAFLGNARLTAEFQSKAREFATPALQRVYCPQPTCSAFLGTSVQGQTMNCHRCGSGVCMGCKRPAHGRESCQESTAVSELRDLAQRNGWQTCPGCHAIVELHHGCYHMTCRCRAQFCYVCAAPWKNCQCPQWEEARLLDTAERRVAQDMGNRAAVIQPVAYQEQVRRAVATLRVNHDCVSHRWQYRRGEGRCEECRHHLPQFLLVSSPFFHCLHCTF
uniref:RBR-type E3 ubiquitin transferase n=1 Tax=Pleurotus djamor TaxID=34470 RepID=Q68ST7_PLEDJ|nr:hypothetical protein PDUPB2 [Pleurotus djamor]